MNKHVTKTIFKLNYNKQYCTTLDKKLPAHKHWFITRHEILLVSTSATTSFSGVLQASLYITLPPNYLRCSPVIQVSVLCSNYINKGTGHSYLCYYLVLQHSSIRNFEFHVWHCCNIDQTLQNKTYQKEWNRKTVIHNSKKKSDRLVAVLFG